MRKQLSKLLCRLRDMYNTKGKRIDELSPFGVAKILQIYPKYYDNDKW